MFFFAILFVSFSREIQKSHSPLVASSPSWKMLTGLIHYFLSWFMAVCCFDVFVSFIKCRSRCHFLSVYVANRQLVDFFKGWCRWLYYVSYRLCIRQSHKECVVGLTRHHPPLPSHISDHVSIGCDTMCTCSTVPSASSKKHANFPIDRYGMSQN